MFCSRSSWRTALQLRVWGREESSAMGYAESSRRTLGPRGGTAGLWCLLIICVRHRLLLPPFASLYCSRTDPYHAPPRRSLICTLPNLSNVALSAHHRHAYCQLAPAFRPTSARTLSPALALARRHLSSDARAKIQAAVNASPVVLFMKGTPAQPQCGFSRAAVQVLDMHGVGPEKMQTYNVLEDAELRTGIKEFS